MFVRTNEQFFGAPLANRKERVRLKIPDGKDGPNIPTLLCKTKGLSLFALAAQHDMQNVTRFGADCESFLSIPEQIRPTECCLSVYLLHLFWPKKWFFCVLRIVGLAVRGREDVCIWHVWTWLLAGSALALKVGLLLPNFLFGEKNEFVPLYLLVQFFFWPTRPSICCVFIYTYMHQERGEKNPEKIWTQEKIRAASKMEVVLRRDFGKFIEHSPLFLPARDRFQKVRQFGPGQKRAKFWAVLSTSRIQGN